MEDTEFYVEFAVNDAERFEILQNIFDELKTSKDTDSFKEDEFYLKFFDDKAKSHFRWNSESYKQWWNDSALEEK